MSVFFQAAEIVIHMLISNVTSSLFGYILFYEHHLGLVQEFKKVTHIFLKLYWRNILPNKICSGLLSLFFQTLSNKCTKEHKTLGSRPFIVKGLHLHYHGLWPYIFISKVIKYMTEHMYALFTRCGILLTFLLFRRKKCRKNWPGKRYVPLELGTKCAYSPLRKQKRLKEALLHRNIRIVGWWRISFESVSCLYYFLYKLSLW